MRIAVVEKLGESSLQSIRLTCSTLRNDVDENMTRSICLALQNCDTRTLNFVGNIRIEQLTIRVLPEQENMINTSTKVAYMLKSSFNTLKSFSCYYQDFNVEILEVISQCPNLSSLSFIDRLVSSQPRNCKFSKLAFPFVTELKFIFQEDTTTNPIQSDYIQLVCDFWNLFDTPSLKVFDVQVQVGKFANNSWTGDGLMDFHSKVNFLIST